MNQVDQSPRTIEQIISDTLDASNERLQQHLASIAQPPPIHMGTINLNDLLPDISIELSHIIALLKAAFEQIEPSRPTTRQTDVAAWLLSDALREAREIYQRLYETKPLEEAA